MNRIWDCSIFLTIAKFNSQLCQNWKYKMINKNNTFLTSECRLPLNQFSLWDMYILQMYEAIQWKLSGNTIGWCMFFLHETIITFKIQTVSFKFCWPWESTEFSFNWCKGLKCVSCPLHFRQPDNSPFIFGSNKANKTAWYNHLICKHWF